MGIDGCSLLQEDLMNILAQRASELARAGRLDEQVQAQPQLSRRTTGDAHVAKCTSSLSVTNAIQFVVHKAGVLQGCTTILWAYAALRHDDLALAEVVVAGWGVQLSSRTQRRALLPRHAAVAVMALASLDAPARSRPCRRFMHRLAALLGSRLSTLSEPQVRLSVLGCSICEWLAICLQ